MIVNRLNFYICHPKEILQILINTINYHIYKIATYPTCMYIHIGIISGINQSFYTNGI